MCGREEKEVQSPNGIFGKVYFIFYISNIMLMGEGVVADFADCCQRKDRVNRSRVSKVAGDARG